MGTWALLMTFVGQRAVAGAGAAAAPVMVEASVKVRGNRTGDGESSTLAVWCLSVPGLFKYAHVHSYREPACASGP